MSTGLQGVNTAGAGGTAFNYVVDVQPSDGTEPFRAAFSGPWDNNTVGGFKTPEIGQVVGVQFKRRTREVRFDPSDRSVYRKGSDSGKAE
ncbi:MAG TPA: hypothetical protein VG032_08260 [Acidimicrobiales bacterium]|nr:hypothetical protein [Acidimicrobiales bacterium]